MTTTQLNIQYQRLANQIAFGAFGFDALSAGTYNTYKYAAVYAYTDLNITYTNGFDGQSGTITIPAGNSLRGLFTSLVVNSGTGIAYFAEKKPVIPVFSTLPSISGLGYLGETLTATSGEVLNADSVSGQWHVNGEPIVGATSLTYVVPPEYDGHVFTYVETAQPSNVQGVSNIIHHWTPYVEINAPAWWKADDPSLITESGGEVSSFADAKLSTDLYQDNVALRPSTGVNTIGGRNVLTFNGATGEEFVSLPTRFLTEGNNIQIHCVLNISATNTNLTRIFQNLGGGLGVQAQIATINGVRLQVQNGATTSLDVTNVFDGQPHVFSFLVESTGNTMRVLRDGVVLGSRTFPAGSFETGVIVNNFMDCGGLFGEMFIIAGKTETQADIDYAVGSLAHRFGLTENLAVDHPYKNTPPSLNYTFPVYNLVDGYGQSWIARNGNNGALALLQTPQEPNNVFMLADPAGIVVDSNNEGRFDPLYENDPLVQTSMGPMALRYFNEIGSGLFMARQSGEGGKSVEELAKSTMSFSDGVSSFYNDRLVALQRIKQIANVNGRRLRIPYITWIQGVNNSGDAYAVYKAKHGEMLDGLKADTLTLTGEENRFLIGQQPGGTLAGTHENIKAQADIALERDDCILAYATWSVESQTDGLHFSDEGASDLGEVLALKAKAWDDGTLWDSPHFLNVQRTGTTITMDVGGLHDVVTDETVITASHYVGGTVQPDGSYLGGTPVPNFGFEYWDGGSEVTINSVTVNARTITIVLASDVAGQLRFAWSNKNRGDGYIANRGNIRSTWTGLATYTGNTLYDWAVSGYWDL